MFLTRQSVCQSCFSCQRNSSETAQQNFVKLCNYEGHNVKMHKSYPQEILIQFFFLGVTCTPFLNLEIWPKWKILLKQFFSATPLKPLNRTSWNFVVMKALMCRCAYPQEILIQFLFLGVMPLFELIIWQKLKVLLKTVHQCNSPETAQQNFMKLCSYEGHNVTICIFTGNADLIFFRSNLYPFLT